MNSKDHRRYQRDSNSQSLPIFTKVPESNALPLGHGTNRHFAHATFQNCPNTIYNCKNFSESFHLIFQPYFYILRY